MARGWRHSAAYRIGFAWSAAFAAAIALLGIVVFIAMHLAFRQQIDSTIGDEIDFLAAEYRTDGLAELRGAIAEREASRAPGRLMYVLYDRSGRRIAGTLNARPPGPGIHDITFSDPMEGRDTARGMARDLEPGLRLLVAADREWLERIDTIVVVMFGLAFAAVLIFGAFGGALLGRYLQHRLQTITDGATAIIAGDTRQRMAVGPQRDEFDQVAIILNRMLDRTDILIENLRQVSGDIAHDLRTPLTRLRNYLERRGESDDFAIERVDELLALFAAILRIAEVESGETRRFFESVDFSRLVEDLAESYQPSARESGREMLWSIATGIAIRGDPQLLTQAIANLLDNALRHTPEGTIIRLTLTSSASEATVCVSDNGPGIPTSERSRVTRRFQRLDRSRSTPGFGLGLSLTSAVAALHGGRLTLGESGPGLEARIDLPFSTLDETKEQI